MRYLVITMNAAIDVTYALDTFRRGTLNRALETIALPGGKGNNVARALSAFGHDVVASGVVGGAAGRFIDEGLRARGIDTAFVEAPGESRRCLTFVEQESGVVSEVLERGIEVSMEAGQELLGRVGPLAKGAGMAVVSGSLPPGLAADYYARLVEALHAAGVPVAVDSSGEPFRRALEAQPELIKPNRAELADLLGESRSIDIDRLIRRASETLIGPVLAAEATIVASLGAEGAALVTASRVLRAIPPPVRVVNPVGAGDALLAGFLHGRSLGLDEGAALRWAVATGTAAAGELVAGTIKPLEVERLLPAIDILTSGGAQAYEFSSEERQ